MSSVLDRPEVEQAIKELQEAADVERLTLTLYEAAVAQKNEAIRLVENLWDDVLKSRARLKCAKDEMLKAVTSA